MLGPPKQDGHTIGLGLFPVLIGGSAYCGGDFQKCDATCKSPQVGGRQSAALLCDISTVQPENGNRLDQLNACWCLTVLISWSLAFVFVSKSCIPTKPSNIYWHLQSPVSISLSNHSDFLEPHTKILHFLDSVLTTMNFMNSLRWLGQKSATLWKHMVQAGSKSREYAGHFNNPTKLPHP